MVLKLVPNPHATTNTHVAFVDGATHKGQRRGGLGLVDHVSVPEAYALLQLLQTRLDLELSLGSCARILGVSVPEYCKIEKGVLVVVSHTEAELIDLLRRH